jgi:hypothetical protein
MAKRRVRSQIGKLIKNQESPRFPCVQVVCHILLESSQQQIQLCYKIHLNQRSAHKVMGPQSCRSPNFGMWTSWKGTEYTIKGKVVASPKSESWWVLWVQVCPWLILAPKCSNYALTNLLFGLYRFVWVIKCLSFVLVPISEVQHTPLPSKCYEPGSMPQLLTFPLFSLKTHIWVYQRTWECVIPPPLFSIFLVFKIPKDDVCFFISFIFYFLFSN